ncbi:hypothetical protein KUCAC02_034962, partial [Chaenocephalus aceratus]
HGGEEEEAGSSMWGHGADGGLSTTPQKRTGCINPKPSHASFPEVNPQNPAMPPSLRLTPEPSHASFPETPAMPPSLRLTPEPSHASFPE